MQFRSRIKGSSASAMLSASSPAHPKQSSVSQSDDPQTTAEYLWVTCACRKACYMPELLFPCRTEGNARE